MDSHARILLVDDDPNLLSITSRLMREAGHHVDQAQTGQQALSLVNQEKPDLVLLDVVLPDISGLEVCRRIKQAPQTASCCVILISGYMTTSDNQVTGLETGADGYITRPISERELLARVDVMLRIKHTEMALQESEERYRGVVEDTPVLVCCFLPDGEITFVNQAYCAYFGKTLDELVGTTFLSLIPEANRGSVMANLSTLQPDSPTQSHEHPVVAPSGEVRWQRWTNRAVFNDQGHIVSYQSIGEDITDRKRTEEALAQEQAQLYATLYSIGDAVIATDTEGCVTRMNPVAEHLTGWSETQAHGKPLAQVFHIINEITREPAEPPVARVLCEGKVVGLANHTLLVSADGLETPIADAASPVRDKQGNITGVVLVFRDQTEERITRRMTDVHLSLIDYAADHGLDELLVHALDEIGGVVDSPIGFYHVVERDQKSVTLQQWSSCTINEFCHAERERMHYSLDEAGVWADCVRERKPVIHNDYASLAHRKMLPEGHAELVRELVVPVLRGDRVVAVVGVGNKPGDYTQRDVTLVSHLADVTWEIAQRKRAEEELQNSEERWRSLTKTSPDHVLVLDTDLCILFANHASLGLTVDELIGTPLYTYVEDEQQPRVKAILEEVLETGNSARYETVYHVPDGMAIHYESHVTPRRGTGSEDIIGLVVAARNTTERRRVEQILQESEKRFQYAMEATSDGLYDWNMQTGEVYFSPGYLTMLGYAPDEWPHTFETYQQLLHPEDAIRSQEKLSQYLSGQTQDGSIEMRLKSKSGEWVWVLSRGMVVERDDEGRPLRMVGTNVNISQQKQTEEALQLARQRAQQYLDVAEVMLIALDTDQRVTLVNPKACEVLGYSQEEIVGQNWFESFLPDESVAEVKQVFDQIMSGNVEPVRYHENPIVRKDGSQRLIAWNNSVLRDNTGKVVGLFSSGEDITERKRTEETLRYQVTLLKSISDAVITTDLNFIIESWNSAAESLYL